MVSSSPAAFVPEALAVMDFETARTRRSLRSVAGIATSLLLKLVTFKTAISLRGVWHRPGNRDGHLAKVLQRHHLTHSAAR
jgi:hypothetical protein